MTKLEKKLDTWKQQGFISPAQLESILAYESKLPGTNWTLIAFTLLAVATISLGIISLIAYNWHLIPPPVKLTTGFVTLFATAGGVYYVSKRQMSLVKDGLIAFFILYCFVMIGLIAQIYNLQGPVYQTGFFWSAITVLVASFASHVLIRSFWVMIVLMSAVTACFEMPYLKDNIISPFTLFMLSIALVALLSRKIFKEHSLSKTFEYGVLTSWVFGCLLFSFDFHYRPEPPDSFLKIAPQLVLAGLIIAVVAMDAVMKKSSKVILTLLVCIAIFNAYLESFAPYMHVLQAFNGIAGFVLLGLLFYSTPHPRLFNLMFALVGLKVFEIFIRNASGLLATGLGLVLAGVLTLLAIYGWNKNKARVEGLLQELLR